MPEVGPKSIRVAPLYVETEVSESVELVVLVRSVKPVPAVALEMTPLSVELFAPAINKSALREIALFRIRFVKPNRRFPPLTVNAPVPPSADEFPTTRFPDCNVTPPGIEAAPESEINCAFTDPDCPAITS